jgi:HSP20 family protein
MEQARQMNSEAASFNQNDQLARSKQSSANAGDSASNSSQGREIAGSGGDGGARTRGAGAAATTILPPVDIFEDESGFTIVADMPGVSREQLGVRVTGDNLVIEGTAAVPVTGEMELLYGEVSNPQYRRSFTLSRELDPTKIEAKLNNGVLRLTIPKSQEARPRRIEVSVD